MDKINKQSVLGMILAILFISSNSFAYDFEVDGLCYNKLSSNQVEITYKNEDGNSYSGNLNIPEMVLYNGVSYHVTSIGEKAFYRCRGLTGSLRIPNSIISIGDYAFEQCNNLTGSLIIPNSVISIGKRAFVSCVNLTGTLEIPNTVTCIGDSAFCFCTGLTGSLSIPVSLKEIGDGTFISCSKMTGSLTIPNTITRIGQRAFYGCSGLTGSLIIPNSVTSIGPNAFYECSSLTGSLTIPNSINKIETATFAYCSGFTGSLTIPNSITSIGGSAFSNCSGLTGSLIIPNSVTFIGPGAFYGCSSLTGSLIIPSSINSIESTTFSKCSGLTGLTIPNTVTSIDYAFSDCTQLNLVVTEIENPFDIHHRAFYLSSGRHKTLGVPKGTKHKYQALSGWADYFTEIVEMGDSQATASGLCGDNATWTYYASDNKLVISGTGAIYDYEYNNYPWYSYRDNINTVVIENGITCIGSYSFYNCSHLTSVTISNSMTSIEQFVFYGCKGLTSITVPNSVTTIGDFAFSGCSGLASLSIPISVTKIGDYAFYACSGLSSIKVESGNMKYDSRNNCNALVETVTNKLIVGCKNTIIPNSVSYIGDYAFYNCSGLSSISIPNSLTNIGKTAFGFCTSLTSISIPNSVTSIGGSAFSGCYNLALVKSYIANPYNLDNVFQSISPSAKLQVPKGTKAKYQSLSGWANYFKEIVEMEGTSTTYELSVIASGNGLASYGGTTIRGKTSTFTVNAGTSATITFTPDNGYRIKSVKVNNTTVSVSNNQYTISNINANMTVSVEFEAIPPTTYTLTITARGYGSASYGGETIRSLTSTYTINKGTSVTITFTPDNGYQIKAVKVNGSTVSVSNNQYTVSNINQNTTVEVSFEKIPTTTYTLSITASGSGSASYSGATIRSKTSTFTVNAGSSATITFTPDNGYRIKNVKVNNTTVSVSNNQYTISSINSNTTVSVEFEAIPVTTYTLTITARGNGTAVYGRETIRFNTSTFSLSPGTSATISFTPDDGYRIKYVKVNGSTVSVSNNQYTVSNINQDTTVEVSFEEIPTTTYTLSITASGNGSASYSGTTIRSKTSTFTVNAGSSATITFTPDNGYRIKSVKVNNTTVSVSNNQYTVSNINANTTVSVEFEAIPPTTYTLSITASGNGSASYSGTTIRSKTSSFTLNAGSSATITFSPDNGYQIKSVKVNNSTVSVSNNQYTISSINANTTVSVEFEAIPVSYTLSITATGNGSASYDGTTIRSKTSSFTVNEGTTVKISITPDNGYRIKSVKENNTVVTSYVSNGIYTINSLSRNTTLEVEFEEILQAFSADDVNYTVVSVDERTIRLAKGSYGITLEVPAKVSYQNVEWTVTGIDNGALANNPDLAAIVWNPDVAFTEQVSNLNLLLYVNQTQYAPSSIKNVVVNGNANSITLTDAASGNNFHCPQAFTAQKISYTHNYSMETGIGEAKGWETIALPFDVQKVTHESKGEIVSFANWRSGDAKKPFWLMQLSGSGWTMATSIKANTPYIISMPKNDEYKVGFWLNGRVTFSAENVNVPKTENLTIARYNDETFVPTFVSVEKSNDVLALNVVNDIERVTGSSTEGSTFVKNLRPVHPFEAYKTSTSSTRSIGIDEGMATGIIELISALSDEGDLRIYNLNGQLIKIEEGRSLDEVMRELPAGVYIVNGKKMIIR